MEFAIHAGFPVRLQERLRRKQIAIGTIVPWDLIVGKKKPASRFDCRGIERECRQLICPKQLSALSQSKLFAVECKWTKTREIFVVGPAQRVAEVAVERLGERPIAVRRHRVRKRKPKIKKKADGVVVLQTPGHILNAGTGSRVGHAMGSGGKIFRVEGLLRRVLKQIRHKPHAPAGDSACEQDMIVEVPGFSTWES